MIGGAAPSRRRGVARLVRSAKDWAPRLARGADGAVRIRVRAGDRGGSEAHDAGVRAVHMLLELPDGRLILARDQLRELRAVLALVHIVADGPYHPEAIDLDGHQACH